MLFKEIAITNLMVFAAVIEYISSLIQATGYTGVFILMVLESMIVPVPSEAVMPFAGILAAQKVFNIYLLIAISGLASVTGSLLSYAMGRYGGLPFLKKYGKYFLLDKKDLAWSHRFFNKYGKWAILIARFIPILRHVISIPAGIAKMNLWRFIWATFLGATTWNFILAYMGYKSAGALELLKKYSRVGDGIVLVLIVLVLVWYIDRHWELRKRIWKTK